MNQDRLPLVDLALVNERLPRSCSRQRNGRRFFEIDIVRLASGLTFFRDRKLSVAAATARD